MVATLDALLSRAGFRVGRYTSPHLVDFRERISVAGHAISERAVVDFADRWLPAIERTGVTFFEATTCLAFEHFASEKIDVAIVEVGLGGRLDATNVIRPLVAAVTSIGLDHTEYLGPTLEQIAYEKAGIFKHGVPAVIGERDRRIAAELEQLAESAGAAPVVLIHRDRRVEVLRVASQGTSLRLDGRELHTPLIGRHQASNTAVAVTMIALAGDRYRSALEDVPEALARVSLPGRFQRHDGLLFDVSHNLEGIEALCDNLIAAPVPRPLVALVGVLRDKPWREMLQRLVNHVDRFVFTEPPSAPHERAWALSHVAQFAATLPVPAVIEPEFDRALAAARMGASTTLVTGSFHTVGDAMARLQASPRLG